jgi:hypothetical protein
MKSEELLLNIPLELTLTIVELFFMPFTFEALRFTGYFEKQS